MGTKEWGILSEDMVKGQTVEIHEHHIAKPAATYVKGLVDSIGPQDHLSMSYYEKLRRIINDLVDAENNRRLKS